MNTDRLADAALEVTSTQQIFPCHRILLSVRSTYFKGYLQAAGTADPACDQCDKDSTPKEITVIPLHSAHANAVTVVALLTYLYTDRMVCPRNKLPQLEALAVELGVRRLAELAARAAAANSDGVLPNSPTAPPLCSTTFEEDLLTALGSPLYSDVVFVHQEMKSERSLPDASLTSPLVEPPPLYSHKCILSRVPYFETLFKGGFSEADSVDREGRLLLPLAGLEGEGITMEVFKKVLCYCYSGTLGRSDAPRIVESASSTCGIAEEKEHDEGHQQQTRGGEAVSYTHLTLPTIYSV